jgi:prevent-host-death family protein
MDPLEKEEPVRVGVRELRRNLSGLLRDVRSGATVVVTSRNQVVALIQPPPRNEEASRRPGRLRDRIWIAGDFDETPEELLGAMEGDED